MTRKAKVEADFAERNWHEMQCSQDTVRLYNFSHSVNGASAQTCIGMVGQWFREDPSKPITIIFNSPGGSVIDGLAVYDFITELRNQGATIETVTLGMAASMAGVLLQAGDNRVMGRNSVLLIHEVSSGAIGNISQLEDEVAFSKKLQDKLLDILADRSTLTKSQIKRRWKRKDWWLDAEEALELGFCDEIR